MDKKSLEIIFKMWVYGKMWMHNMHYYYLLVNNQYFSMLSLLKVSKLYFHTQFKSHNIQNLNNKRLISTFYQRTTDVY
jgi:hypothetical protein